MKNRLFLIAFLFLAGFFLWVKCNVDPVVIPTADPYQYVPFPSGFNYPVPRATLDQWVQARNMDSIRSHAWSIWAGLNQPTPYPDLKVWQTWHSIFEIVKNPPPTPDDPGNDDADAELPYPNYVPKYDCPPGNGKFLDVPLLLIANIYYNQATFDWITGKRLHHASTLDSLLNEGYTDIPQAPEGAVIVKHVYWPVSKKTDEYSILPMWDGPAGKDPLVYNGFETWDRAVAVTANPNPPETVSASYLHRVTNRENYHYRYDDMKTVNIDQFYHIKLDANTLGGLSDCDTCVINNCFNYAFNRDFEEGDYLVSLGMHMLTKEISDWTMQTVWWHDQPDTSRYAQNKPANIPPGPWQNYLISTAYFMATPSDPAGKPHFSYNPYIELVIPEKNRIRSNCQNCHVRAAFPVAGHPFFIADMIESPVTLPASGAYYYAIKEGYISPGDSIFDGLIRTDFNWSIPDRAE
jgi:hypothetical protein